jgi:hypothetical protein
MKKRLVKKINIRNILSGFKFYEEELDIGKILSVKDGVARVNGLLGVLNGEMVQLGTHKSNIALLVVWIFLAGVQLYFFSCSYSPDSLLVFTSIVHIAGGSHIEILTVRLGGDK